MKAHARFFFLILICIFMGFSVGIASAEADRVKPFSTDYEAINEAAQSMFLVEVYDRNDTLIKTGSGFIAFDEHYFVTNHHVIEDAKYLVVVDDNGKEYKVTDLLVADEEKDIAILSFDEAANYRPLPLCATDDLLRGQPIVAIGSPKGVRNTVTTGNISNLIDDNGTHIIQFTAAASPGSSGGAIFNDRGEVIGLMFSKRTDAENMNYAVEVSELISIYKTINGMSISLESLIPQIPSEILLIDNTEIHELGPKIFVSNITSEKSVSNFIIYYYYDISKKNSPYMKNIFQSIMPQETKQIKFDISSIDRTIKKVNIGIKYIKLNDGTIIKCPDDEIKYYTIKIDRIF